MKTVMGQLIWDEEKGLGYVIFNKEFRSSEAILCLDALSDWVTGFTFEHRDHYRRLTGEFKAKKAGIKRVTKKPPLWG